MPIFEGAKFLSSLWVCPCSLNTIGLSAATKIADAECKILFFLYVQSIHINSHISILKKFFFDLFNFGKIKQKNLLNIFDPKIQDIIHTLKKSAFCSHHFCDSNQSYYSKSGNLVIYDDLWCHIGVTPIDCVTSDADIDNKIAKFAILYFLF